jgi:hypothetical protein
MQLWGISFACSICCLFFEWSLNLPVVLNGMCCMPAAWLGPVLTEWVLHWVVVVKLV